MSPVFVELLGLPGAGKSSLAQEVVRILAARGYSVSNRPPLVTGTASYLGQALRLRWFRLTRVRLAWAGVSYALSVRPFSLARPRSLRQAFFLAHYLAEMRKSRYEVVLMSQSVLNALWAAAVPSQRVDEGKLERFFSQVFRDHPGSIAFVSVRVPASTAAERVVRRARPGSRFDALPIAEATRLLSAHQDLMCRMLDSALRVTGAPLCEVDGTASPKENAARIAEFIQGILQVPGSSVTVSIQRSGRQPENLRKHQEHERDTYYA